MLMSDVNLKSYTDTAYHNDELKSLTRYRFDKVRARAKLKQSVARLVNILFPELEKVPSLHVASVYALLSELPGAYQIASCNLTHLKTILVDASKGRYGRDKSIAKYACLWDPTFAAYLSKKCAEGKHYNVAISHSAKKLVRLIFAMEKSGQAYRVA